MQLLDQHGRRIRKLRLSLTDKCNLRCHYCMPLDQKFMSEEKYLHSNDYQEIIKELCDLGLEELRITGGEPLLRKSFNEIIEKVSVLPLKKLGLTTNGVLLDKFFDVLRMNKILHLNISLDSLNEDNFRKISRGDYLSRVFNNILLARDKGFLVKVNMVVMKGINDHEVMDFIKFAEDHKVEVRFLELMRIGYACKEQTDQFISAHAVIKKIKWHHELEPVSSDTDSTSFNYVTEKGAKIGFIASESQPFCGQCSRWRLSADGMLRACLMKDDGLSLKGIGPFERLHIYQRMLGMKPGLRPIEVRHSMNSIGG